MSAQDAKDGEATAAPDIRVSKKIVPFEEGSPDEEPLFVNCLQVAHAGGVAYIDVGVLPLDEILMQPQTTLESELYGRVAIIMRRPCAGERVLP
jgi:hypothetical protein